MNATAVLDRLNAAGVRVNRRGDKLLAQPRAAVTEPVLALLQAHKAALLAALPDQLANAPAASTTIAPEQRSGAGVMQQADDFDQLLAVVAPIYDTPPEQYAVIREAAANHMDAALECYRELAASIPIKQVTDADDDRIFCIQCVNLIGVRCAKWRQLGVAKGYAPVQWPPRRCEEFKPKADDADQRTGAERWPNLAAKKPED